MSMGRRVAVAQGVATSISAWWVSCMHTRGFGLLDQDI
jgi:hypothetical protein